MTLLFWIAGAIAVLLFLYLFAAMLKPELFS